MIEVYRKHHPARKALVERIEAMDRVIVQAQRSVVYRFCGLTEEEIAVVEGRAKDTGEDVAFSRVNQSKRFFIP